MSRVDVADGDINFRECIRALIDFKVVSQETQLASHYNLYIHIYTTRDSFVCHTHFWDYAFGKTYAQTRERERVREREGGGIPTLGHLDLNRL